MLQPAFIDSAGGCILCTVFDTPEPRSGRPTLLFLPPFAEEQNKSRRMMARLGHALSGRGVTVAIPDLYGTGDSSGEFAEADWSVWRRNVLDTAAWLESRGSSRLMLGGLRLGALLALDVIDDLATRPDKLLFWSPVLQGRTFMTQFLRLRVAAALTGGDRETTDELRARLSSGESVRVAGYELPGALATTIEGLDARTVCPPAGLPVSWYEVSRSDPPRVPPVARQGAEEWEASGCEVELDAVRGDSFWATQEIVDVPELVRRSADCLQAAMR